MHGGKIVFRRTGWFYSLVLIVGLLGMTISTSLKWYQDSRIAARTADFSILSDFAKHIHDNATSSDPQIRPLKERIDIFQSSVKQLAVRTLESVKQENSDDEELGIKQTELIGLLSEVLSQLKEGSNIDSKQVLEVGKQIESSGVLFGEWDRKRSENSLISQIYDLLIEGLFNPLGSAMFSLLSVYIAVAAYRAFKIQSVESALMMLAAVIVILGQTSFGLMISSHLPATRQWLMEVPNSAAFRAIKIGSAVAGLVLAFRMWLSIETKSFNQGDQS